MRKFLVLLAATLLSVAALAQTPDEIISKMEAVMNAHENDGLIMTMEIKMPIIGAMSTKTFSRGDKVRMEIEPSGKKIVTWIYDGSTWTYDSEKNEVEIQKASSEGSSSGNEEQMLSGITEGYDVSIKKETDTAWYILCKKSKDNKKKDDPKTMDLVVRKSNFYPISLSAKMSGVTMTLRDIDFGVSEAKVTFDPKDYPGVKIIDKR